VQPDQTLDIDRIAAEAGETVEFAEVLLLGGNGDVQVGTPFVEGARVVAEVLDQGRGKKLLVFKYKNKTRYRRRRGHRQAYTRLAIKQILTDGQAEQPQEARARTQRRRAAPKAEKETAEAAPETAEASVFAAEAKPTRARRPRAAAASRGGDSPEEAPPEGAATKPARRRRAKKTTENEEVTSDGT
jgi:large subunit ribosomal protein L21